MERGKHRLQVLRKRREKAIALFEQGERQATVASLLKVSRQSASRWFHDWLKKDLTALHGSLRAGRKPKLTPAQLSLIEKALLRGARANWYTVDLWNLPRIAGVIEALTGVHFHPGHVWRILRQMNWSLQRPTLQAKERNEKKIGQWKSHSWGRVKKIPKAARMGSFP